MAHTPGSWTTEQEFEIDDDGNERGKPWWTVNGDGFYVATVLGGIGPGVTEANARLIAAAPDLLAALKTAIGADPASEGMPFSERIRQAEAAIAKAEGRS